MENSNKINSLGEVLNSLKKLNHQPNKKLGQNFLVDENILNFIVNAAHAIEERQQANSTEKGFIKVTVRKISPELIIQISDNGIGMSEQVRQRIFDPFFTTKGVGKGTGQGLSLAYNVIVEKHKGRIEVDSVENSGTTFSVCLPLKQKLTDEDPHTETEIT